MNTDPWGDPRDEPGSDDRVRAQLHGTQDTYVGRHRDPIETATELWQQLRTEES